MRTNANFLLLLGAIAASFLLLKPITYNWDGEDSYISYRVAENFARGEGLVFNRGERVEAHSNFLWTLILGIGGKLGFHVPTLGKILAALSVAGTIFLLGLMRPRLEEGPRPKLGLVAPLLYLFHPIAHYQCDRALETSFYVLLLSVSCFFWLRRRPLATSVALAAVAATRPEGFGFFGLAVLLALFENRRGMRASHGTAQEGTDRAIAFSRGFWLRLVVPFVVLMGALTAWRLAYYGYPLPNTVYAKTSPGNFWRAPAFPEILQFQISCNFLPLWALLALAPGPGRSRAEKSYLWTVAAFGAAALIYIAAIGQVATSFFRHYVPAIPFIVLLLQELVFQWRRARPRERLSTAFLVVILLGLTAYTSQNRDIPASRLHRRLTQFIRRPDYVERARRFFAEPINIDARTGRWLAERYPPETKVVSGQMGQMAYYSGLTMIDILGLADKHVAHAPYPFFTLDYALSRDPDLWALVCSADGRQMWQNLTPIIESPRFAEAYVLRYILKNKLDRRDYHYRVFVRRDSDHPAPPETLAIGMTEEELQEAYRP
jgi:arabinofuranosyltransferase